MGLKKINLNRIENFAHFGSVFLVAAECNKLTIFFLVGGRTFEGKNQQNAFRSHGHGYAQRDTHYICISSSVHPNLLRTTDFVCKKDRPKSSVTRFFAISLVFAYGNAN